MTTCNFQPDDPRLTAYALGELGHSERTQVDVLLAESAEARMALEEIRETIALLRSELAFQSTLTLTSSQREIVEQAAVVPITFAPNTVVPNAIMSVNSRKTSRWVVIVRAATTVAAVAAVAVAVPLVSRSLQDGLSSPSASESLSGQVVTATRVQPGAETAKQLSKGEAAGMSGQVEPDDDAATHPVIIQNGEGNVQQLVDIGIVALTGDESDAEKPSQPVAERGKETIDRIVKSDGKSNLNELLTADVFVDGLQSSPGDSPETLEYKSSDYGVAKPAGDAGDAAGSKSRGLESGSGESNDKNARLAQASVAGDGNASPRKSGEAAREGDSTKSSESEEIRSGTSESLERSDALTTAPESIPSVRLEGMATGGGLGGGREQLQKRLNISRFSTIEAVDGRREELEQLAERIDLGKEDSYRRRTLSVAAPGSEAYDTIIENAFTTPMEQPLSTFSIDVDTASYANTRRFIQQGQLPPHNAVRIEELVNYFRYDYPEPTDGSPFSVNVDVATCPWEPQHKLARIGLKARTIAEDKRPATNLVFLIDVSGSMAPENKLPLVKQALSVLVSQMGEDDQIAIVTYAGEAGLKLNSTSGSQRNVIQQAIDSLSSGGSTNGAAGIQIAYDTAIKSFIKGGANRVILCTDGDFNVGVSDDNTLVEIIQEKAASGVFLSVFGFGMGNLKDAKLEKLADKGNGNYGYIDGLQEARKVFGEQLSGTLITVAKDVKLQLEFSNATVGAYRLIGYENRVLAARDFDDDTKDAGEIGAGHTVTALYEIVPKAVWLTQVGLNPEKFDIVEKNVENKEAVDGRLFTVKLRHKLPDGETSERSMDYAAMNSDIQLSDSNMDFQFAAAVASFGMQIRDSKFRGQWTLQNVLSTAEASLAADRSGERTEFTDLVRGVMRIKGESIVDPRLTSHSTAANQPDLKAELSASDARIKATVDGKYRRLLKKIEVRNDVATYGEFQDFGPWDETAYSGHSDLPTGYWVWVYPNWYIWGDAAETPSSESVKEAEGTSGTSSPNEVP